MTILRKLASHDGVERVIFWCPGCDNPHAIPVSGERAWGFNGDFDAPTFKPSIKVTTPADPDPEWQIEATCCHSFVTDGQIQFLGDCTHTLAGQTVPLPEWVWPHYGGLEE